MLIKAGSLSSRSLSLEMKTIREFRTLMRIAMNAFFFLIVIWILICCGFRSVPKLNFPFASLVYYHGKGMS